jgi:hypothetical protein
MASQKFRDLVHYVCWKCEDPSQLGATKLNKILWFVDTFTYRRDGVSLTGERYVKRQFGPVPYSMLPALTKLREEGKIFIREPHAEFQPREYVALMAPNTAAFSEKDVRFIDAVIDTICKSHTATSISEFSHDQIWAAAQMGEEIPLYAVLAATPGEITDADMAWADTVIEAAVGAAV